MTETEQMLEGKKGTPYTELEKMLTGKGFAIRRTNTERPSGNRRLTFVQRTYEGAILVEVVHDWNLDSYGIGKPGKVVSTKVIERSANYASGRRSVH